MPSLQIRDISDELYETLKNSAERDHRSLAQQALVLLTAALAQKRDGKERRTRVLEEIRSQKIQVKSENLNVTKLIREDRER